MRTGDPHAIGVGVEVRVERLDVHLAVAFEGGERTRIGCLARDLEAEDISAYLQAPEACVPKATLESVLERTRELKSHTP